MRRIRSCPSTEPVYPRSRRRSGAGVSARVLLIEDNADLAFGLQRNLEFEGYTVDVLWPLLQFQRSGEARSSRILPFYLHNDDGQGREAC